MSENTTTKSDISAARKRKQRAYRQKRAVRLTVIVVAVVVIVVTAVSLPTNAFKDIGDFFNVMLSSGEYPLVVTSSPPDQVEQLSSAFCVRDGENVTVVSASGKVLQTISTGYLRTGLEVDGGRLLVYSVNGRQAALYNRSYLLEEFTLEQNIIAASVGSGKTALLTASERYTGELHVYGDRSNKLFTWYCAEGYPFIVKFNDGGSRVCVGSMYIENGLFKTRFTMIDVAGAEELYSCTVDSTALEMFIRGSELIAVTESGIHLFGGDGELKVQTDFGGRPVTDIAASSAGSIAVCLGYKGHASLSRYIVFNGALEVQCDFSPEISVSDVRLARDRIYLLSDGEVVCYSFNNQLIETLDCNISTTVIVMPRSGSIIALINGTAVKLR